MMDHDVNSPTMTDAAGEKPVSESRRGFLKLAAITGAVVSASGRRAFANGDIGYHAKDLPDEKLIDMYRTILKIRWHERIQADQMLSNPDYRGYNHFYAGQEAVATGVCAALRNSGPFDQVDLVYSSHRPSGHAIAKGVDIPTMVAEMDFRATGMNGGYGAEMHISDPAVGFIGADGMIGPAPVIASGSAFAFRARGSDQVAVVFAGDGNYAAPHFHSTLNNARMLDLPLIYVMENNLYHQYAHYSYSCPHKDIADAADAYGIPARVVDGQDVTQVYNVAKEAVDRARSGGGPSFIEAKTYRYYNHWGAPGAEVGKLGAFGYDPLAITSFRPEREVRAWMQRDPVDIARKILVDWGILEEQAALDMETEVKAEIEAAFAWAFAQPLCNPEDGLKHVFAEGTVPARQFG